MVKKSLYSAIWRWHFYAGLFVVPFIIILSITGAIYLFKPQLDAFQEREWRGLNVAQSITLDDQFDAMQSAYPDALFHHYRLPRNANDAAIFHIGLDDNSGMRDIYVAPDGNILAAVNPENRISDFVSKIHATLLIGEIGKYMAELAASWAIIMILSGLYLWWPNERRIIGVIWPRIKSGRKIFWRDMHAVTGFWVSGLALILLISGLPWTQAWASGFDMVRAEMGWVNAQEQDWNSGGAASMHIEHDHQEMLRTANLSANALGEVPAKNTPVTLERLDEMARHERLEFPIIIRLNEPIVNKQDLVTKNWKISSQTQDRPLRRSLTVDGQSGEIVKRDGFEDRHIIDRIISYGIAWHEGQLLGWFNQFVGVMTAMALLILCFSGIKMWWGRRPLRASLQQRYALKEQTDGVKTLSLGSKIGALIGAPPIPENIPKSRIAAVFIIIFAILLPLFGLSLLLIISIDSIFNKLNKSISPIIIK